MTMVKVRIAPEMKAKCPRVALASVSASVIAGPTPERLRESLRAAVHKIVALPEPRAVLEAPQILATRSGYKALGKDPARYRGSAEALLRRVISGKELPEINAVVDIINLVSVDSRLPIGLYDAANVSGDVDFRPGRAGETYKGIGKYDLNLEGMPLFADAIGPHGSATSDSERTMVTTATTSILAIIISFGGADDLERWSERMAQLFEEFAEGKNIEQEIVK